MQVQGVIHGTKIELNEDPGLADGAEVDVILLPRRLSEGATQGVPGDRPTAAGMLAHLPPEVDEEIEAILRDRARASFREILR